VCNAKTKDYKSFTKPLRKAYSAPSLKACHTQCPGILSAAMDYLSGSH